MATRANESGTAARTRGAILDAAVGLLGRRPDASLGEVAAAADVGRTTLHRYYAERADLLDAVSERVAADITAAVARARPADGDARDALLRAARELFDLGPALTVLFGSLLRDRPEWRDGTEVDSVLVDVVERGRVDGTVNPELSPLWIQNLLWSMLYAADSHAREAGGSRHDALALALTSLDGALRPAPRSLRTAR